MGINKKIICKNANCKEELVLIKEDSKGNYYECPVCGKNGSVWIPKKEIKNE